MLAAKIAALILKQLRSCRGVGEAGAFGRYQDFGICPKRAHRCEPLRLPEVKPQSGPPCHHENEIADSRPIRLADGVLCGRTALKAPVKIELDSREATDGAIFSFGAQAEEGITTEHATEGVTDLYWHAFLLTGAHDISIDIAADADLSQAGVNPFFATWFRAWSRKIVIANAVAAVRDELWASVRRTEVARVTGPAPLQKWSLPASTTKTQIERALLAVDAFPRTAVLLSIFEGISIAGAATVLDADVTLVRKAQAIGVRELTTNLARNEAQPGLGSPPKPALARSAQRTARPMRLCSGARLLKSHPASGDTNTELLHARLQG